MKIILTGGSGMVGERILPILSGQFDVFAPTHVQLDITNRQEVQQLLTKEKPEVIIHAAAATDNSLAEAEGGNKNGHYWQVNVEGTRHIIEIARNTNAFVILLSTGSVFCGTKQHPGPFAERDQVASDQDLSWYAITKKSAEQLHPHAIVRVSHPVGGSIGNKQDYLERMISLWKQRKLFPLLTDQFFALTSIPDLAYALIRIAEAKVRGVFHVVSVDQTSPYQLMKQWKPNENFTTIDFQTFIEQQIFPKRFSQYYALDGNWTAQMLHLPKSSWKDLVKI